MEKRSSNRVNISFNVTQEPLSIPLDTVSSILTTERPSDALAFFSLLYYRAKIGGCHRVRILMDEISEDLRISEGRARDAKKSLIGLGLVEEYSVKNAENSRIISRGLAIKLHADSTFQNNQRVEIDKGGESIGLPLSSSPLDNPLNTTPPREAKSKASLQKTSKKVSDQFRAVMPTRWYNETELMAAWGLLLNHLKELNGKALTPSREKAMATQLVKFANSKADRAVVICETAVARGWKGIWALSEDEYQLREAEEDAGKYDNIETVIEV